MYSIVCLCCVISCSGVCGKYIYNFEIAWFYGEMNPWYRKNWSITRILLLRDVRVLNFHARTTQSQRPCSRLQMPSEERISHDLFLKLEIFHVILFNNECLPTLVCDLNNLKRFVERTIVTTSLVFVIQRLSLICSRDVSASWILPSKGGGFFFAST